MRTSGFIRGLGVVVLMVSGFPASADFRPPSVPVVACDPFFSIWMPNENPTLADSENWFGARQPIKIMLELDGREYRLFGGPLPVVDNPREADLPALHFVGCEVRPLTSVFRFSEPGGYEAELLFRTAKIPTDLDLFSTPVVYGEVKTKGAKSVRTRVVISEDLARNGGGDSMKRIEGEIAACPAYAWGKRRQRPLSMCGDEVRCDWGWAWCVNGESVGAEAHFLLAYDDIVSLEFLDEPLLAWWRRGGKSFRKMLAERWNDFDETVRRVDAFDRDFSNRMQMVGGDKYCTLAALAFRQSFAACKLVAGKDGEPLYFSKENTSNGSMGTVDVFYPQFPLLLLENPVLATATLKPILVYATSGKWPYPYAPHDVGTYPWGDGQTYAFDPTEPTSEAQKAKDSLRMPVEECGNMLISLDALAQDTGDVSLADEYWGTISGWSDYLERFGFDPGDQLCTDDFAGHLSHNANLSIKSILAFAAYADLANRLGKTDVAERFRGLAEAAVPKWLKAADGGAHGGYRLAFDQPGTWSMKYNLVWDRVLGFDLFPGEVAKREMSVYRRMARPFGIPLDGRREYAKVDWLFWCATMTGVRADLDFVTALVYRYADETPDRNPFPDWYFANNGRVRGFLGRSVIGGVFMPAYAAERRNRR